MICLLKWERIQPLRMKQVPKIQNPQVLVAQGQNHRPKGDAKTKKLKKKKAEEQAIERQTLNVKKPDISMNILSRKSDVPSHGVDPAKTSDNNSKKESSKVAKFKSSENAAKKKESLRPKVIFKLPFFRNLKEKSLKFLKGN